MLKSRSIYSVDNYFVELDLVFLTIIRQLYFVSYTEVSSEIEILAECLLSSTDALRRTALKVSPHYW